MDKQYGCLLYSWSQKQFHIERIEKTIYSNRNAIENEKHQPNDYHIIAGPLESDEKMVDLIQFFVEEKRYPYNNCLA